MSVRSSAEILSRRVGGRRLRAVPWRKSKEGAALRLICLPFAGGSAIAYRPWLEAAPAWLDVCPVELAGRGVRIREEPIGEMERLVAQLVDELRDELTRPYALFGHSFGALISFAIALRARQLDMLPPVHCFLSGSAPPGQGRRRRVPLHQRPHDELIAALRRYGGTPEEALNSPELMKMLAPALRADLRAAETWDPGIDARIDSPASVFAGSRDLVAPPERVALWTHRTSQSCANHVYSGGHFFLFDHARAILSLIADTLFEEVGRMQATSGASRA